MASTNSKKYKNNNKKEQKLLNSGWINTEKSFSEAGSSKSVIQSQITKPLTSVSPQSILPQKSDFNKFINQVPIRINRYRDNTIGRKIREDERKVAKASGISIPPSTVKLLYEDISDLSLEEKIRKSPHIQEPEKV